jgi:Holliday junction resolvase RusA-like endonuclease
MRIISFDIDPVPEPRMVKSDRWNQRPSVMRYFAFCNKLRIKANFNKYVLTDPLDIKVYLKMPKSWSEKKRIEMDGKEHRQRPDGDNLLKSFMDALSTDDSYMADLHVRKYWAYKGRIDVLLAD